jgi:hypothetical protein
MRGFIRIVGAMLVAASSPAVSVADQQPICANRPGKSTPTCTVPIDRFQVEIGLADWSLQKSGGDRDTSLVIGETNFLYGLTDHSDIEVDVTPWQRATSSGPGFDNRAGGIGDVLVTYKHRLTSGDGPLQIAVAPVVKIPTAKRALGNGKWEGGLLLPIDYAFGRSPFSVNLTPEVDWVADADGAGHHAAMAQVASLGLQVNPELSVSAELWGQWDWDPSGTTRQYSADGSVAYLVSQKVQLDGGFNIGLNRVTPDVEFYVGIAKQF